MDHMIGYYGMGETSRWYGGGGNERGEGVARAGRVELRGGEVICKFEEGA